MHPDTNSASKSLFYNDGAVDESGCLECGSGSVKLRAGFNRKGKGTEGL